VKQGYVDYWNAHGGNGLLQYSNLKCQPSKPATMSQADYDSLPQWQKTPFQGCFSCHGTHFFFTHDSDNGTAGVPVDEVDGQQWRYAIPESQPTNWIGGDATKANYALNVIVPLQANVLPYGTALPLPLPNADVPEVPFALMLPFVAIAVIGGTTWVRRRQAA
jgi:hypothetical protein